MTNKDFIEVIKAYEVGAAIDRSFMGGEWEPMHANHEWNLAANEYRIHPREWWLNVYPNKVSRFASRDEADHMAFDSRIECIHVREVLL